MEFLMWSSTGKEITLWENGIRHRSFCNDSSSACDCLFLMHRTQDFMQDTIQKGEIDGKHFSGNETDFG
jgi:hypothetical protein